jgi:hypothetical protein
MNTHATTYNILVQIFISSVPFISLVVLYDKLYILLVTNSGFQCGSFLDLSTLQIGNRSSENVAQLKYLGMAVTNENDIQEEIKKRMNSGNACYHSNHNLFCFRLLSK